MPDKGAHDSSAYGGATAVPAKKLTVPDVVAMKRDGRKIVACCRSGAS